MLKLLDGIPFSTLLIIAVLLGLAPFQPEPHLVEKLRMLSQGVLSKPLDIFDLILHASAPLLLLVKSARMLQLRLSSSEQPEE